MEAAALDDCLNRGCSGNVVNTDLTRMEAKDGSMGFDFAGTYDVVKPHEEISYTMEDGSKVSIYLNIFAFIAR
ncbi:hypothetical protein PRECH8_06050 [Insulibacter thermoxylanivorax]|uniref:Uncharacterized protein n=1 Tax=Insulibacter thermoxylanivorax TaxID=2749268 RepID=A0A916VF55_9BACL|nr:hypothetical protein PRECH8_06050 [Insulibacter thermoxylanivorax]